MTENQPTQDEGSVSALDDLIKTCKDGESGFRAAAEAVSDSNLRHLFESYAQQRAEFAAELQRELRRLADDEPADSGHASAALHRGWIDVKATLTGRDEAAIIAECERGEDVAVQAFRKALDSELPSEIRVLVERQFLEVKDAHDHIRSLERTHSRES
jgi:uncharacterized protein (TIGR02284 family)